MQANYIIKKLTKKSHKNQTKIIINQNLFIMKKIIFFLALIFMASVSYLSAQNLVPKNHVTMGKEQILPEQNVSRADYVLKYYAGTTFAGLGNANFGVGTFYSHGCISFTSQQMYNYVGGVLDQISFYFPAASQNLSLVPSSGKVWIKNSLSGAILYEQSCTVAPGAWNDVILTTPYTLTTNGLVLGFSVTHITTSGTTNEIRPMPLTTTGDTYKAGGANYIIGATVPNTNGVGANWNVFTTAGNLVIEGYVSGAPALPTNDLAASIVASPALKWVGTQTTYAVTVWNTGTASQSNYTVQLLDAANAVIGSTPVTTALAPGAFTNVNVTYTPTTAGDLTVKGKVILSGDAVAGNDISDPLTQKIYAIQPMGYCTYNNNGSYGATVNPSACHATIGYLAAAMTPFVGKQLTALDVYLSADPSDLTDCSIWVRSSTTGANLYTQPFTPTVNGWNTIILTTPYNLQSTNTFIGYTVNTVSTASVYPLSYSVNTPGNANGGHFAIGTSWYTLGGQNITGNMNIVGTVAEAANNVTITTAVNPIGAGTVTGGGTYAVGAPVTLTASDNLGYTFASWTPGGSTANPLTFNATVDATYTANFQATSGGDCPPVQNFAVVCDDGNFVPRWAPPTGRGGINIYTNPMKTTPSIPVNVDPLSQDRAEKLSKEELANLNIVTPEHPRYSNPRSGVLYDNGPFITHPGAGAAGADASAINDPYSTTYGMNASSTSNYSVADDFIFSGESTIETVDFYVYQTSAPSTTSTITAVFVRIWDASPMEGGTIIWGDMTTNRMISTEYSNVNRTTLAALTNTDRRLMKVVADIDGLTLQRGVYWIEMMFSGSLASGPWIPPVTVLGIEENGNGVQRVGADWQRCVDGTTGNQFELVFVINGTGVGYIPTEYNVYRDGGLIKAGTQQLHWRDKAADPYLGYTYAVTMVCEQGESDPMSATMEPCKYHTCQETEVPYQVGEGTVGMPAAPIGSFNYFSYAQQIYDAAEIGYGSSGEITALNFQYIHTPFTFPNVDIYLGNTTKTTFASTTDWVLPADMELVYNGPVVCEAGWIYIELDVPFVYSGNNVVVAVNFKNGINAYIGSTTTPLWNGTATSGEKTIHARRDGSVYDPTAPGTGTRLTNRPNIKFNFCEGGDEPGECNPATNLAVNYNLNCNSATLSWTAPAGKSTNTQIFSYTGAPQPVELQPGTYEIEVWGADGGNAKHGSGGKGGYSKGTINVTAPTTYYVYVGGKGGTSTGPGTAAGGWNGGGVITGTFSAGNDGGTGGGGTDIRTTQNDTYANRIIVGGGGGGADGYNSYVNSHGGAGGGLTGGDGTSSRAPANLGQGGTQTAGGAGATQMLSYNVPPSGFGTGGGYNGSLGGCAGGGGWYGGGAGHWGGGGGAGSGNIDGVTNGITIKFGEPNFVANPDPSGNGYAQITGGTAPGNVTYNVYRGSTLLTTTAATNYTATFENNVPHTWSVKVVCEDGGESDPVTVAKPICQPPSGDCDPATGLTVAYNNACNSATLSWTAPAKGKGATNPDYIRVEKSEKEKSVKKETILQKRAERNNTPGLAPNYSKGILLSEGFEDADVFDLPDGWTETSVGDGWWWFVDDWQAYTGDQAAACWWDDEADKDAWMFSPGVALTQGVPYTISFWALMGYNAGDGNRFEVKIAQNPTISAMNSGVEVYKNLNVYFANWTQITYTFTPTTSGTYYLGFHDFTYEWDGDDAFIDDVLITSPDGPTPGDVTYNIYLDGALLVANHEGTTYTASFNNNVPHTWSVTVACETGDQSLPVEVSKPICVEGNECEALPIVNFTVDYDRVDNDCSAILTWNVAGKGKGTEDPVEFTTAAPKVDPESELQVMADRLALEQNNASNSLAQRHAPAGTMTFTPQTEFVAPVPFRGETSPFVYTTASSTPPFAAFLTTLGDFNAPVPPLVAITLSHQAMVYDPADGQIGIVTCTSSAPYVNSYRKMDPETGATVIINSNNAQVPDCISMALNPVTGIAYATEFPEPSARFGTIDLATGIFTQISTTDAVRYIAIDVDGTCYALNLSVTQSTFGTLNLTTGAFTQISTYPAGNWIQDINIDPETGILYHAFRSPDLPTNTTQWRTINKATGAFTILGTFPAERSVESFVIAGAGKDPCPAISGLTATQAPGQSVNLTWTAASGTPTGYEVRFNGTLLETVNTTSFTHSFAPSGQHSYCVRAIYPPSQDCGPQSVCQSITVTEDMGECEGLVVPSGTTTGLGSPIYTTYNNAYTQTIYNESEIGDAVGALISGVAFGYRTTGVNAVKTIPVAVYIGTTTKSEFGTPVTASEFIPLSELTLMYSGTVTFNAADQWTSIDFEEPFEYDGGNLVIAINQTMGTGWFSSSWAGGTLTQYKTIYAYDDYNQINPAAPAGSMTRTQFRANLRLRVCPGSDLEYMVYRNGDHIATTKKKSYIDNDFDPWVGGHTWCVKSICPDGQESELVCETIDLPCVFVPDCDPAVIAVTRVAGGNRISWTNEPGVTGRIYRDGAIIMTGATSPYVDPLGPIYAACYKVELLCPNDFYTGMSNEVCLPSEPYTIPYFCDFETQAVFNEWTVIDLNGGNTWTRTTPTTTPPNNGLAQYTWHSTLPANDWMISPPIMVPAAGEYRLTFKYGTNSTSYLERLRVTWGASNTVAAQTNVIHDYTAISGTGGNMLNAEFVVVLPAGILHLGYYCYSIANQFNLYVDEVKLEGIFDIDMEAISIAGPNPTVGNSYDYTITVKNKGINPVTNFKLQVLTEDNELLGESEITTFLAPEAVGQYTVPVDAFTAAHVGILNIKGYVDFESDMFLGNNTTPLFPITVSPEGTVIIEIGDPNATNNSGRVPYNLYYRKSLSQSIYFPHEFGTNGGIINNIAYQASIDHTGTNLQSVRIRVWIGEVDNLDNLNAGWVDPNIFTEVYDGIRSFPTGKYTFNIPLATPYEYNGKILVIYSQRYDSGYGNSTDGFKCTPLAGRSRMLYKDDAGGAEFDLLNPTGNGGTLDLTQGLPNAGFTFNMQGMGSLSGVVSDDQGAPIEGVKVQITGTALYAMTNADGFYRFLYLKPGNYAIEANLCGAIATANVTIYANMSTVRNFSLHTRVVFGTVKAADGQTFINGATLKLEGGCNTYETESGPELGLFEFPFVFDGPYTIYAEAEGFQPYTATIDIIGNTNLPIILLEIPEEPRNVEANYFEDCYAEVTWGTPALPTKEFRYDSGINDQQIGFPEVGTRESVIGSVHRESTTLFSMSWYSTTNVVQPAYDLWVLGLTNNIPDRNKVIFKVLNIPNTPLQWCEYEFPEPVACPDGFFIGVSPSNGGFTSVGTDAPNAEWPFVTDGNYYSLSAVYPFSPFGESSIFKNCMIRAIGTDGGKFGYVANKGASRSANIEEGSMQTTLAKGPAIISTPSEGPVVTDDSKLRGGEKALGPIGYKLWRLVKGEENNQAAWVTLTNNPVTDLRFVDYSWNTAAPGMYRYAVRTCYHGGVVSDPAFSNVLDKLTEPVRLEIDVDGCSALFTWNNEIQFTPFYDDMESYQNFIIADIGDYILIDVDGANTFSHTQANWPNATVPKSYMVFNPSQTALSADADAQPHSGNKYLTTWSSDNAGYWQDDWLILPKMKIAAGVYLKFWAKSYRTNAGVYQLERFKVGVSTTDPVPAAFTFIQDDAYISAPENTWTEYSFDLTAYAGQDVYLAINVVSVDSWFFMLDDISVDFPGKGSDSKTFLGYNVYLDGKFVTQTTETEYTFTGVLKGDHVAGVTSVFACGESTMATIPFTITDPACGLYKVTFEVTDMEGNPIPDAFIEFNGEPIEGNVVEDLPPGTYPWVVSALSYVTQTGNVIVADKDMIVPVKLPLGINDYDLTFGLFPNPATDKVTVKRTATAPATIEVYNAMGMHIAKYETDEAIFDINITTLSAGTYFIRVIEGDRTGVKSFVKK